MKNSYCEIIEKNLEYVYSNKHNELANFLPAEQFGDKFKFIAFGENCTICSKSILLNNKEQTGAVGVILSLYARHVNSNHCELQPFVSFRDFPNSMPYVGTFSIRTEQGLIKHVEKIAVK